MPNDPTHISLEPLFNNRMIKGPAGTSTDSQLAMADSTPVPFTPSSGVSSIHFFNNTGGTVNYGGASVSDTTGVKIFNQGALVIDSPSDDFQIYFYQTSGGPTNLDYVEFF
jgi:hypothetical protein